MLIPPQPKEKPLRTKRGHRKPTFLTDLDSTRGTSAFVQNSQAMTLSPSNSDAFSHTQTAAPRPAGATTNGTTKQPAAYDDTPKKPRNPFELFVNEHRNVLLAANRQLAREGTYDVDKELAIRWQELGSDGQSQYHHRFETGDYGEGHQQGSLPTALYAQKVQGRDEDVEMVDEGEDEEEG